MGSVTLHGGKKPDSWKHDIENMARRSDDEKPDFENAGKKPDTESRVTDKRDAYKHDNGKPDTENVSWETYSRTK